MATEKGFLRKKVVVTSSKELKIMVQNFMNIPDIGVSSRKPKIVLSRYLVVQLALIYTHETWNDISNTLRYKDHASISHAMKQWENLKGQKVLDPYEFYFKKISEELDFRIEKKSKKEESISLQQLRDKYRIRMWMMNRMHHSIRTKLVQKLQLLENENRQLKSGNL